MKAAASLCVVLVAIAWPVAGAHAQGRDSAVTRLAPVRTEAERSERREFDSQTGVGRVSITGAALRAAPVFVEPDLLRSIQLLPGVAARSDYAAGFNIRGGENDQNLILIDGYPIYNPFHLGGLFSTFIDPSVGDVALYRGALPARYGGRLSSVLDVRSAEPITTGAHGTAELSLVSSTASLGGALAGGAGSWLVAARRTYADAVVNLFHPGAFPYHFQDVHGHLARRFDSGFSLSLTGYDGLDLSSGKGDDELGARWGNSVVGLTIGQRIARPALFGLTLGDSLVAEQRASITRFHARVDIADFDLHAVDDLAERRAAGSLALARGRATHTIGYELATQRLALRSSAAVNGLAEFLPFDSTRQRSRSLAAYVDEIWRPIPSLLLEGGWRLESVDAQPSPGILPRFSVKYFLTPTTALSAAGGRYMQWMHSLGREEEPVQPLQFWVASDSAIPVSHARDAIAGVEHWITPSRFVHVEAFYKRYDDALVPNPLSDPGLHGDEFLSARGTSYGADLMLRQLEGGSFSGWLAYSYTMSSRLRSDGVHYYPPQDRRHNLNVVGSWRRAATSYAVHVNLASGMPYTPVVGMYNPLRYDPYVQSQLPTGGSASEQSIAGEIGSARLPWYDRVDVSATRRGHVFGAAADWYLSILNLFNAHNAAAYFYDNAGRSLRRQSVPNLPIFPTFGVRIAY